MDLLAEYLISIADTRPYDECIGDTDNPYLLRWYLKRSRDHGNVYLHHFLRSDDDRALHDHPWSSTSRILRGFYIEHLPGGVEAIRSPGDLISRTAESPHRIELMKREGRGLPVWSLFTTGPKEREWGFHCESGWKHWTEFDRTGCGD